MGSQPNTKGYPFLNLKNHKSEVSRDVIFHENHFPYHLNVDAHKSSDNFYLPIPQKYNYVIDFMTENFNYGNVELVEPDTIEENSIVSSIDTVRMYGFKLEGG